MGSLKRALLTQSRLMEVLDYNPATGIFTWIMPNGGISAGSVAGCVETRGYVRIRIDDVLYHAHRLAWLYMTGEFPIIAIDHINLNKTDNRWANLRSSNKAQNSANRSIQSNNTSGFKGVYLDKRRVYKPWVARIGILGKYKHLGHFHTPEEAHLAYIKAARIVFGEYARFV